MDFQGWGGVNCGVGVVRATAVGVPHSADSAGGITIFTESAIQMVDQTLFAIWKG